MFTETLFTSGKHNGGILAFTTIATTIQGSSQPASQHCIVDRAALVPPMTVLRHAHRTSTLHSNCSHRFEQSNRDRVRRAACLQHLQHRSYQLDSMQITLASLPVRPGTSPADELQQSQR